MPSICPQLSQCHTFLADSESARSWSPIHHVLCLLVVGGATGPHYKIHDIICKAHPVQEEKAGPPVQEENAPCLKSIKNYKSAGAEHGSNHGTLLGTGPQAIGCTPRKLALVSHMALNEVVSGHCKREPSTSTECNRDNAIEAKGTNAPSAWSRTSIHVPPIYQGTSPLVKS